jgi:Ni,Fe-hydrogenase III large subunit
MVFQMLDLLEDKEGLLRHFDPRNDNKPVYSLKLQPDTFAISLIEGWRGEICHCAITDEKGKIVNYKVKDPSFHNWLALALSVRGQEISDFPLCNKSFNLSYCGNDL